MDIGLPENPTFEEALKWISAWMNSPLNMGVRNPYADSYMHNRQPLPPGSSMSTTGRDAAVARVVELVNILELAQAVSSKQLQQELMSGAESSLDQYFNEICGNSRPKWPIRILHGPTPDPWIVAVELVRIANAASGGFREGLLHAAGRLADKAFSVSNHTALEFAR